MMEAGIAYGLLAFFLYAGAVPLLLRLRPGGEPATIVLASAFVLWLATLAGLLAMAQRVNFWAYSTSYWFLVLCFLMAFGAIYKSISLRVVARLLTAPGHSESHDAIARDVLDRSYEERLALIADKGYADRREDGFELTQSGRRIAAMARTLQSLFGIARSG
jgi:hypothetical protein